MTDHPKATEHEAPAEQWTPPVLNLPAASFRWAMRDEQPCLWDVVRRRYVLYTPEEWVRQHVIHLLHHQLMYPLGLMRVERGLKVSRLQKRTDLVVYKDGAPFLLVECKAPGVTLDQQVMDQAARYNLTLRAPYLFVTNGLDHRAAMLMDGGQYAAMTELPAYKA